MSARGGHKVCLVGDCGVGKTCIALRHTRDEFDETITPTLVRELHYKELNIGGQSSRLCVWDTSGEERFRSMAPIYYRHASGFVLVYDITDRKSFSNLHDIWFPAVQTCDTPRLALTVVGNKVDLESSGRAVSVEDGQRFAESLGAVFLETSAKTGHNMERIFTELALRIGSSKAEEAPRNAIYVSEEDVGRLKRRRSCKCHRS